jgi:membrane protein YdbS with pleckstrin-like domain
MSFSNQSVTADLISLEAIDLEPLTLSYRKLNLGLTFVTHTLIIGLVFALHFQPFFEMPALFQNHFYWIVLALALLAMTELTYHWFADQIKAYALREHDIHYRSGLFFRKHICQPLLRVQHIEIKRGPFERKAGLATLQVFSAGGAMQTFNIPGLAHETAIRLRSYILGHEDLTIDE